jgi:hypothetical protein
MATGGKKFVNKNHVVNFRSCNDYKFILKEVIFIWLVVKQRNHILHNSVLNFLKPSLVKEYSICRNNRL